MSEIKKLNGYTIKDETARNDLRRMNSTLTNEIGNLNTRLTTTEEGFNDVSEGLNNEIIRSSSEESNIRNEVANVESSLNARMDTFTSLAEGSTTGDAELIDARIGENGKTYTSAGSAIRENDKISHDLLKINDFYQLSNLNTYQGQISGQGKWTNINSNYNVVFIPVTAGENYYIEASTTNGYCAFITDVTPNIVDDADVNLVSGTSRIVFSKNTVGIVPATATYLVIPTKNSSNVVYNNVKVGNRDYMLPKKNSELTMKEIQESGNGCFEDNKMFWIKGASGGSVGNKPTYTVNNIRRSSYYVNKRNYKQYVIPDSIFKAIIYLLNDDFTISSITTYSSAIQEIPANTNYIIVIQDGSDNTAEINNLTNDYINQHIKIVSAKFYNTFKEINVNWCALGDSITQGYYSYMDGETPSSAVDNTKCWVKLASIKNNWNLTNNGVGGQGYLYKVHDVAGYEYINTLDFTNYDLVTLAYGINDWKGNQVVGSYTDNSENPTTVCGALKNSIEYIMSSNPNCKIIVILPFNAWGYSFNYGNKASNYGLGYEFSNSGTLESFTEKIKEVCDYYCIEYIDETHYSCINRENLPSLLLDGVHPSLNCHKLLAQELAKKINAN